MVLSLLFSYIGIVLGYLLAMIAPEELASGKTYFILLKKIFFGLIVLSGSIYLIKEAQYLWFVILLLGGVGLFILKLNPHLETSLSYVLSSGLYFVLESQNAQFLIVSLIFLYGFPVGLMLHKGEKKSQRKHAHNT